MAKDDLSQQLWRENARIAWREDRLLEHALTEPIPDTPQTMILKDEIEYLKGKVALKQKIFQEQVEHTRRLQDMISYVDLHISNYPITQLTTEQKELWADSVDLSCAREAKEEGWGDPRTFRRWWRNDYVGPMP